MAPPSTDQTRRLLAFIKYRFEEGILVAEDALHYIDSTLSNPTSREIEAILVDESHPERDSLLELIFYPDLAIQISVEKFLQGQACSEQQVERLRSALCESPVTTAARFEDGRGQVPVTVPVQVIEVFIDRLNLTRSICARIIETLRQQPLSEADRILTTVRLRNTRVVPDGSALEFLCRYIQQMASDRLYWEGLDFILVFLEQIGPDDDIYEALMFRKRRCHHALREIERAEEKRRRYNMETLMLRGERFPHADRKEVLKTIGLIDRIAGSIYGKTEWIQPSGDGTQSVSVHSAEDLTDIMRLFSAPHTG